MNEIFSLIGMIVVAIIAIALLISLVGVLIKVGIVVIAAALIYRLYLNYKLNNK